MFADPKGTAYGGSAFSSHLPRTPYWRSSQNHQKAKFANTGFCEVRVATALPVFTYLLPRVCARLTPRHRGGCTLSVDLGVLCSFFHSFRSSQPSGWTFSPLRLLLGLPVLSLRFATPPAILCRLGRGCAELRHNGVLRSSDMKGPGYPLGVSRP
jgi:hypothetical protein